MNSSKASIIVVLAIIWMRIDSFSVANEIEYRLPFFHRPLHYQLSLELDPDADKFDGELVIHIIAQQKLKFIVIHASPNRITNIKEVYFDNTKQPCNFSYIDDKTEMLNISCGFVMQELDDNYLIIKYDGVYGMMEKDDGYFGLYKSSEGESNYLATQSEPIYARTFFPCYDEPEYKAVYEITVKHPEKYNVLSNAGVYNITTTNG